MKICHNDQIEKKKILLDIFQFIFIIFSVRSVRKKDVTLIVWQLRNGKLSQIFLCSTLIHVLLLVLQCTKQMNPENTDLCNIQGALLNAVICVKIKVVIRYEARFRYKQYLEQLLNIRRYGIAMRFPIKISQIIR